MDMNWIDEIRDPEPRKRYIYNADDYDPQYGDPYYREHSTRADSLWRLYEESGASITFDAFADESRQTDYRMETGALRDFFNGSQSALSSYRNPMGGNPLIAFGSIGRWDGERTGISSFETFDDLMNGDDSPFKDCEIDHIWDENGILKMRGHHHDGSVEVEIRQLTDQGCEALESYEQAWAGEPFDAAGRRYDGGKESVDRFWNDMETDRGLSVEPRYVLPIGRRHVHLPGIIRRHLRRPTRPLHGMEEPGRTRQTRERMGRSRTPGPARGRRDRRGRWRRMLLHRRAAHRLHAGHGLQPTAAGRRQRAGRYGPAGV